MAIATPQDKPSPFTTPYSPIIEREREREGADDYADGGGCGCFRRFCFGRDDGGSHSYLLQEIRGGGVHGETWVVAKFNKLKQWSEVVAGPKWKNFIRKIGRHKKQAVPPFQYSPESYALNFAGDQDHEEDGHLSHSFSSRFAVVNDQHKSAAL